MIFGAIALRYSISIFASRGGISNAMGSCSSLRWQAVPDLSPRPAPPSETGAHRMPAWRGSAIEPACNTGWRLQGRPELWRAYTGRDGALFHFGPDPKRKPHQAMQDLRIVELAERTLVLAVQSRRGSRELAGEPPQFIGRRLVDLDPLIGDLDQRASDVPIEDVFGSCPDFVATKQDLLEVLRTTRSASRRCRQRERRLR